MQIEPSSEHPIDPAIRAEIMERLLAIEKLHDVRVLFACESGSRGWGFASPDSDYDVRFIYVHALQWYLRVDAQRDVIEEPVSAIYDVNGWELRKALALLRGGNATLIEWLDSPVVYRADNEFLTRMRECAQEVHRADRSFHHYFHMAKKNYREYLQGDVVRLKKYLYVLRPILAARWVIERRGIVPMRFQELVDALVHDAELRDAIDALLIVKRKAKETDTSPAIPVLNRFIEIELAQLESVAPPGNEVTDATSLDRLLHDTILGAGISTSTG